jgi:hypothetical protein
VRVHWAQSGGKGLGKLKHSASDGKPLHQDSTSYLHAQIDGGTDSAIPPPITWLFAKEGDPFYKPFPFRSGKGSTKFCSNPRLVIEPHGNPQDLSKIEDRDRFETQVLLDINACGR